MTGGLDAAFKPLGRESPDRRIGRGCALAAHLPAAAIVNAMTVDVEDYFQVSAFSGRIDRDRWEAMESRVERNTEGVLALFSEYGVQATFFTLGWIAQRHPGLVRRIVAAGHELASHGWEHIRVSDQTAQAFRADVDRTKKTLEDLSGQRIDGYRAASFSIGAATPWAFEVLGDTGHRYSSSVYPIRHDHYGMPAAPRFPWRPAGEAGVLEVPVTTVRSLGRTWPAGGGGYFRLFPYALYRLALRRVNSVDRRPGVLYFHPWEIDPHQPRITGISARTRIRHYTNLGRMAGKVRAALDDFRWDRMDRVFLDQIAEAA